jgi:hypothetical protein
MSVFKLRLALLPAFVLVGCGDAGRLPSAPAVAPVEVEVPDPAVGSYAASFDPAGLDAASIVYPDNPFIRALDVGPSSLVLVAYTTEGSIQQPILGPAPAGADVASAGEPASLSRIDVDAWASEAWLGRVRYHVAEGTTLVAERVSDEVASVVRERAARDAEPEPVSRGITLPPKRAASGPTPATPAPVPVPRAAGPAVLWKRDLAFSIAAGPIAFENLVLVATSRPSWIGLDRATGEPVFERPLDRRLYGPLVYVSDLRALVALGADGALCSYSALSAGPAEDPVSLFLGPGPDARKRIEDRAAELVSSASPLALPLPVYPVGGRPTLPALKASLHKFDCSVSQTYRIYVDGAGSVPALIVLFSAQGDELLSNLEYSGVGQVFAKALEQGATYYALVASLSDESESIAALSRARLVFAPKK